MKRQPNKNGLTSVPKIVEYRFTDYKCIAAKIKHPTNITGSRKLNNNPIPIPKVK